MKSYYLIQGRCRYCKAEFSTYMSSYTLKIEVKEQQGNIKCPNCNLPVNAQVYQEGEFIDDRK